MHEPVKTPKPPYAVPTMAEIGAVRGTNGLSIVSTFSGCGGSCLGFEMAGYRVLWASEFVEAAREVYALNHPDTILDGRDIRHVKPGEILDAIGLEPGQLDVLEGSPPCASFSTAGKRHKGWGQQSAYSDTKQRTDDLFFEYARLLEGIQPRAFIAENVSGLVKGVAKGYFKEILARLRSCGYRVEAKLLDAQWLGVPQARQRLIFQGVRDDLGRDPAWPTPLPYRYSVRDALPWIAQARARSHGPNSWANDKLRADHPAPTVATGPDSASFYGHHVEEVSELVHDTSGQHSSGPFTERPAPTILVSPHAVNSRHYQLHGTGLLTEDPETGYRITLDGHALADEWDKLAEGQSSDRYFNLVRPDRDRPAPTVTQANNRRGVAGITHPVERRKFTLLELRRICAFPDDFELAGTYQQRWERLGRAVPPLMMRAVAEALRDGPLCAG